MSSVLKEVPARAPPARRPPSYGASAGRSPRPPPRGPPGPPPPKPPTASSTSAASPPPAMPRSGAATPGPPMSSGPPGSTPARPPVPGSANGRPPPKLSGTPGAPPPRPTGELGRLKAQLATANEAIAAADQRRKVEIDAMEQANNQLMLEVVDLKDELDETNELMSQYEENRDTRREVIMEKEITQLQAQLRNTLKERDTIRVTMESMQEEYTREKTYGLSSKAIDAMASLVHANAPQQLPMQSPMSPSPMQMQMQSPMQVSFGGDTVGTDAGAGDGDDDYGIFANPDVQVTPNASHSRSAGTLSNSGSAAVQASAGASALVNVQMTSARETELERQLLKARKEKERALKVIMTIIGAERVQEHLRMHAGQKDILTSLVDACAPGGSLSHFQAQRSMAAVATIKK